MSTLTALGAFDGHSTCLLSIPTIQYIISFYRSRYSRNSSTCCIPLAVLDATLTLLRIECNADLPLFVWRVLHVYASSNLGPIKSSLTLLSSVVLDDKNELYTIGMPWLGGQKDKNEMLEIRRVQLCTYRIVLIQRRLLGAYIQFLKAKE